ncbi:MAG: hypothetical protein FJX92_06585 [Bacteroidetes bacterium]|nr:hypothetical protein [Bacteroidota bacterium]
MQGPVAITTNQWVGWVGPDRVGIKLTDLNREWIKYACRKLNLRYFGRISRYWMKSLVLDQFDDIGSILATIVFGIHCHPAIVAGVLMVGRKKPDLGKAIHAKVQPHDHP